MQDNARAKHRLIALETSALFRRALAEICAERQIELEPAATVGEALIAVERTIPTAIVTAFQLPAFTGESLIAALRSSPRHRAIPIALMTATECRDEQPAHLRPDAVIPKDHEFKQGLSQFLKVMGVGVSAESPAAATAEHAARLDATVLLAEDTHVLQKLLGRLLHVAGAQVTMVENGAEAVTMASQQKFDLVLMDIEMPVMDGRQAVKLLRQQGVAVPIIAVTAHDKQSDVDEFISLGFNSVVNKPVARLDLIAACQRARETIMAAAT